MICLLWIKIILIYETTREYSISYSNGVRNQENVWVVHQSQIRDLSSKHLNGKFDNCCRVTFTSAVKSSLILSSLPCLLILDTSSGFYIALCGTANGPQHTHRNSSLLCYNPHTDSIVWYQRFSCRSNMPLFALSFLSGYSKYLWGICRSCAYGRIELSHEDNRWYHS